MCVDLFQATLIADGLKVEPSGAKVEGEHVKRENAENILGEERDGMRLCEEYVFIRVFVIVHVCLY